MVAVFACPFGATTFGHKIHYLKGTNLMKRLLRKRWFRVLLVLIIVVGAVAYWLWPRRYDITVSRETTYLLSPLHPDGTVNYVAAINQMYSEGVTPENNAAVLLIRATGPTTICSEVRDAVFRRLGMEAPSETGDYFVDLTEYVSQQHTNKPSTDKQRTEREEQADKDLKKTLNAPWSAKDYPLIAEWLKVNEKPLVLVVGASNRPGYYIPFLSTSKPPQIVDVLLPTLGPFRSMTEALVARAMLKAHAGQIEDACSDLMAVHRLARLIGQGPMVFDRLLAVRIEVLACKGASALAGNRQLTGAQAKAHLADLKALPPLPSVIEAIDKGERFSTLDCIATCEREGIRTAIAKAMYRDQDMSTPNLQLDWNVPLRRANQWYDRMGTACQKGTFAERKKAMETATDDLTQMKIDAMHSGFRRRLRPSRYVGDLLLSLFMPLFGRAAEMYDQATMRRRVTEVALVLAACKAEKGKYPETLTDLKPRYLKKIPNDLFIEKPLHYKRTGEGYLLYSVGPDMKDDGGKGRDDGPDCDDIVVKTK